MPFTVSVLDIGCYCKRMRAENHDIIIYMQLENIKKNNEFVWASVFVEHLNQVLHADYRLEPEYGENSPVDMHVISRSGGLPHLDLQLTHAIEVPFVALTDHMAVDFSNHPTVQAIERKQHRLQEQGANLSKLVLIIQGYMSQDVADKAFTSQFFERFKQSPFMGIYYVAPPMMSAETNESMQDSVVVTIKDAFKS